MYEKGDFKRKYFFLFTTESKLLIETISPFIVVESSFQIFLRVSAMQSPCNLASNTSKRGNISRFLFFVVKT